MGWWRLGCLTHKTTKSLLAVFRPRQCKFWHAPRDVSCTTDGRGSDDLTWEQVFAYLKNNLTKMKSHFHQLVVECMELLLLKRLIWVRFPVGSNKRLKNWYYVQQLKGQYEASVVCGRQVAAWLEDRKVPSLSPGQANLVNKMYLQLTKNYNLSYCLNCK